MARMFNVYEIRNPDYSTNYVYNLNIGVSIEGLDNAPDGYAKIFYARNNDNLFTISNHLYGTIDYWWVLAKLNRVRDVMTNFKVGFPVYYLDENSMHSIISTIIGES